MKLGNLQAALPEGIKKLNSKPLIIVGVIASAVILSVIYSINSKADKPKLEENTSIKINKEESIDDDLNKLFTANLDNNISDRNMSDINNTLNNSNVSILRYDNNVSMGTATSPLDQAAQEALAEQFKRNIEAKLSPTKQGSNGSNGSNGASGGISGISGMLTGLTGGIANTTQNPTNPSEIINDAMKNLIASKSGDVAKNPNQTANDFMKSTVGNSDYLSNKKISQLSPYELKMGSVIPGVLISGINSQLPGMVIGQVSDNVYDSATGRYLLIPQGTRLVGSYSSNVVYGQNRVLVAWNRIIFPNGDTLNIEAMNGTDQAGYAGFEDKVNNHYFRIFGSALLISMIGGEISFSNGKFSVNQQASSTQGQTTISQTGNTMLNKNLEVAPTIEIRPGYQFNIFVTKDISFKK